LGACKCSQHCSNRKALANRYSEIQHPRKANQGVIVGHFEGSPEEQRLRKLLIDEPLMRHIAEGGKVAVQLEEWINKSLGRTPVEIFVQNEDGEDELSREWFQYYTGYSLQRVRPRHDVVLRSMLQPLVTA
jgi:hypothetical protein